MSDKLKIDAEIREDWGGELKSELEQGLSELGAREPSAALKRKLLTLPNAEHESLFTLPRFVWPAFVTASLVLVMLVITRGGDSPQQRKLMAQRELEAFVLDFADLDRDFDREFEIDL